MIDCYDKILSLYHEKLEHNFMDIDDEIRNMLIKGNSSDEIKNYAYKERGMCTLWEDAMEKCIAGLTPLEEVLRVTTSE